jgi:hypothetical protein
MESQRTFAQLKLMGDEAFADAQAAIDTARQIARDCRELNSAVKRILADVKRQQGDAAPR